MRNEESLSPLLEDHTKMFYPFSNASSKEQNDNATSEVIMEELNSLEALEATNTSIIGPTDPVCDELEDVIDVAPLSRSSINETDLPTLDQDICMDAEELSDEKEEHDDDPETAPFSVYKYVIREFE